MRKTIGRILGPLGLLLLVFGLASRWAIFDGWNALVLGRIALGLGFIVAWAVLAVEDLRRLSAGRGTTFVVTSAVSGLLLVAALVGANFVAYKQRVEWDLTKNKVFTLSDQTTSLLKALTPETKVTVTAFLTPGQPGYPVLEDLLRRYKNVGGDHFDYRFIDGQKDPGAAAEFNATESDGIIVRTAQNKEARVKEISEQGLTNALSEVGGGERRKVYFLIGHGEKATSGTQGKRSIAAWNGLLGHEGYASADLNLMTTKDVPDDAAAVIVAGPVSPLLDAEREALSRYAEKGGRIALLLDPGANGSLAPLAASWGITVLPGTILDPASQILTWTVAQEFANHPLSTPRRAGNRTISFLFPEAGGVRQASTGGYTAVELFMTGPEAWGENSPIDYQGQVMPVREANDDPGPLALAAASTKALDGDKEFRAVVVGDSDFASDDFIGYAANRDFAMNLVQWLAGQESKITIRPPMRDANRLDNFSADTAENVSFVALDLLPLLLIGFGLTVWSMRRAR